MWNATYGQAWLSVPTGHLIPNPPGQVLRTEWREGLDHQCWWPLPCPSRGLTVPPTFSGKSGCCGQRRRQASVLESPVMATLGDRCRGERGGTGWRLPRAGAGAPEYGQDSPKLGLAQSCLMPVPWPRPWWMHLAPGTPQPLGLPLPRGPVCPVAGVRVVAGGRALPGSRPRMGSLPSRRCPPGLGGSVEDNGPSQLPRSPTEEPPWLLPRPPGLAARRAQPGAAAARVPGHRHTCSPAALCPCCRRLIYWVYFPSRWPGIIQPHWLGCAWSRQILPQSSTLGSLCRLDSSGRARGCLQGHCPVARGSRVCVWAGPSGPFEDT